MKITIIGFDPSTTAWGSARCTYDTDTDAIEVVSLTLTKTESEKLKGAAKSNDDLRRAQVQLEAMHRVTAGAAMVFTELPFFSPQAYPAANFNAGLVIGVLASSRIPLVQVTPQQVKKAACGHIYAPKEEMIEWAIATYPNARWLTYKRAGKVILSGANEHLADAVAVVHAGVKTDQFRQVLALHGSMVREAA